MGASSLVACIMFHSIFGSKLIYLIRSLALLTILVEYWSTYVVATSKAREQEKSTINGKMKQNIAPMTVSSLQQTAGSEANSIGTMALWESFNLFCPMVLIRLSSTAASKIFLSSYVKCNQWMHFTDFFSLTLRLLFSLSSNLTLIFLEAQHVSMFLESRSSRKRILHVLSSDNGTQFAWHGRDMAYNQTA